MVVATDSDQRLHRPGVAQPHEEDGSEVPMWIILRSKCSDDGIESRIAQRRNRRERFRARANGYSSRSSLYQGRSSAGPEPLAGDGQAGQAKALPGCGVIECRQVGNEFSDRRHVAKRRRAVRKLFRQLVSPRAVPLFPLGGDQAFAP